MKHELTSKGHHVWINGFRFHVRDLKSVPAVAAMEAEYGSVEEFQRVRDSLGVITYHVDPKATIRMRYD